MLGTSDVRHLLLFGTVSILSFEIGQCSKLSMGGVKVTVGTDIFETFVSCRSALRVVEATLASATLVSSARGVPLDATDMADENLDSL